MTKLLGLTGVQIERKYFVLSTGKNIENVIVSVTITFGANNTKIMYLSHVQLSSVKIRTPNPKTQGYDTLRYGLVSTIVVRKQVWHSNRVLADSLCLKERLSPTGLICLFSCPKRPSLSLLRNQHKLGMSMGHFMKINSFCVLVKGSKNRARIPVVKGLKRSERWYSHILRRSRRFVSSTFPCKRSP